MDRTKPEEIARAIARLGDLNAIGPCNWAVVPFGSENPFFVMLAPGPKDGPVAGRFLVFAGRAVFRDFMLSKNIPEYGVAANITDFRHYELIVGRKGEMELLSYRPGYLPIRLDEAERAAMAVVLYETYGILMRLEEEPDLVAKYRADTAVFARVQGEDGKWRDGPLAVPKEEVVQFAERVSLNKDLLEDAIRRPVSRKTVWEVDFCLCPQFHTLEAHPRLLYVFAAVDADTGEKRVWDKMSVADVPNALQVLWESLANRLLSGVCLHRAVPGEIRVRSGRMVRFLRPLSMKLPWKMSQHAKLEVLEHVMTNELAKGHV